MNKGTIVVSLRARGVNTFQYNSACDCKLHFARFWKQLVDIGYSGIVLFQLQSFSTWFSVLLMLLAMVFFIYGTNTNTSTAGGFWLVVCFTVILPLLGILFWTFQRREIALVQIAKVKACIVAYYASYKDALPSAFSHMADDMHGELLQLLDDLRLYFQHRRFYARHYSNPLLPNDPVPTKPLFEVSQQLGIRLRTVQQHFAELSRRCQHLRDIGGDPATVLHLRQLVQRLHTAFERASIIKEYRTPQPLRAMLRFYVMVVVPLFTGPYWVRLGQETHSFVFSITFAMLAQLCLVALLTASVDSEDPFNEGALDTISVLEATDHCAAMLSDLDEGPQTTVLPPQQAPPMPAAPPQRSRPHQRTNIDHANPGPRAHPISSSIHANGPSNTTHLPMPPLPPLPTVSSNPLGGSGMDPSIP